MADVLTFESSIDELDLPTRAYNTFKNMNIETIRDLVSHTEVDLLRENNFGRGTLRAVTEELALHDFWFGMPLPKVMVTDLADEIQKVKKEVEGLRYSLSNLGFKTSQQIVNHERLAKVHNEVARAVAKMEDAGTGGASLRDQFAMAALTGLTSNTGVNANQRLHAQVAYELADEMLKARGGE